MADGPDTNDPLGPLAPAQTPDVPGNGRRWVAVLLALSLLAGAAYGLVALF